MPKQTLLLMSVRAQFTTAAAALATRIIYVDLPCLSSNQIVDLNIGRYYIPILLDNAIVTLTHTIQKQIIMSRHLDRTFTVNLYDTNFNLLDPSTFVSLTLVFNTDVTAIT